jgi:LmbE family N-acetylglucosaminyl deacetylase
MRVVVFAAHPDDELLGLGGTVARHADAGDEVIAVIASEGGTSRYTSEATAALETASRAAAEILGIREVRFLGFADQRMDTVPLIEVTKKVEAVLGELRPQVVYTHHWGDLNRDHRVVSEAVQVACRPVGGDYPTRLYCFETPSSSEWSAPDPASQFVPTRFVDVTATIERKLRAMACYTSEVRPAPHPRSLEALRARAALWGHTVGRTYAEAFVVLREVD